MIEARNLSKRYGGKLAVDHLSFAVAPGKVTGFLGPNGAGKSTTIRLLLGLDRPDTGQASIGGRPCRDLADPLRTVGALLEAKAAHSGRTARNHLLCLAQTQGGCWSKHPAPLSSRSWSPPRAARSGAAEPTC